MDSPAPANRSRRRPVVAAGIATAVLAGVLTGYVLTRPKDQHAGAAARPPAIEATPSPAPRAAGTTPAPAPSPAPDPSPAPRRPAVPHEYVRPAVPTSFTITGRGFAIRAHVCAMPAVFPLDPPGEQHHTVCWVKGGFGVKPGSSTATSYVLGHSWAQDAQEVLNKVSTRATADILRERPRHLDGVPIYPAASLLGTRIVLRTPAGTLGYRVGRAYGVRKLDLGRIARVVNQKIRNRVVLITCAERHGVDYDDNVVLEASLAWSKASLSRAP